MSAHVGLLGLGRMGEAIAARLLGQGFRVSVYNRSAGRSAALESAGAVLASRPGDVAEPGGVVLSILAHAAAVRAVCTGSGGLLERLEGGVHLGMSTLAPADATQLAGLHLPAKVTYVSAPVQGRPAMARAGQLVAWVSGPPMGEPARQVLAAITRHVVDLGPEVASAAAAKLAVNLLMNANIALFAEAFEYIGARGVDRQAFGGGLLDTVFAAPLFKAIVAGLGNADDAAAGSDVDGSCKDLGLLVSDMAPAVLPLATAAAGAFRRAAESGLGKLDPVAVRRLLRG